MKSVLRFALLGSLLMALPLAAAQPSGPMSSEPELALAGLGAPLGAEYRQICPYPYYYPCEPECTPFYGNCQETFLGVTFRRQKDNGKCVYRCGFEQTCEDLTCDTGTITTDTSFRVRIGPYPPGACPPPDPSFCDSGEIIPNGEPD
jgi:hypothetical protein